MNYTKEAVEALNGTFGSPFYLFDEEGFTENYRRLKGVMQAFYPAYRIAYSYKTNYTPYICRTAKKLGALAEVVSGMEYQLAKQLGYSDDEILFNGPDKGASGVQAFLNGCMINADSLDELALYCKAAGEEPEREFRIGLRVNLDVGQNFISRFGMDEEDLDKAFRAVEAVPNLKIVGLHCHISRCRDLKAWEQRTVNMLSLADRFFADAPEYLDLGSGMYGSMAPEFAAQFTNVPSYEEYAQVTASLVAAHYTGAKKPVLYTEPGTTLVNRFVDLVANVETVKQVRGHWIATLNCSIHNIGETGLLKRLPITVIPGDAPRQHYDSIDLTGYTCLEQDVLYPGYSGELAKGDHVVFGNVGGYSNVLKPPFIRPNCAMIAETPEGGYILIKSPETYENLLNTYVL